MVSPLHNICQTIHATLLSPPRQFLLTSTIMAHDQTQKQASKGKGRSNGEAETEREEWCLSLFTAQEPDGREGVRVWAIYQDYAEFRDMEKAIASAIKDGMLHVDCGSRRSFDLGLLDAVEIHILVQPEPLVLSLLADEPQEHTTKLLDATYRLLTRPPSSSNSSEMKELQSQISQKDAEISSLNARLASMKATVVRATASDNNHRKVQQSPQKAKPPANASKLQPNQKRRKAVEDEFAGSSDDDEE